VSINQKRRRLYCNISVGVLVIVGLSFGIGGYLLYRSMHTPLALKHTSLTLAAGSSLREFADKVNEIGGSQGEWPVVLWAYMRGISGSLKAGEYVFDQRMSTAQILDKVVRGEVVRYAVTFPEGATVNDMVSILNQAPRLQMLPVSYTDLSSLSVPGIKVDSLEGLFFPDTYYYTSSNTAFSVLRRAHQRMVSKLEEAWSRKRQDVPLERPYDALILASIIEKEAGNHKEKARIGGVFVNRLLTNMRLQADPTVIYGLGPSYQGDLTRDHLKKDTPYNTYRRKGLPPTPISCPGWTSLMAAVQPLQHEEYYFVSKGDGSHQFSRSLQEHQAAVQRYQVQK